LNGSARKARAVRLADELRTRWQKKENRADSSGSHSFPTSASRYYHRSASRPWLAAGCAAREATELFRRPPAQFTILRAGTPRAPAVLTVSFPVVSRCIPFRFRQKEPLAFSFVPAIVTPLLANRL
jgi:hypothetical protein